ncbi:MAG: hypothetical protein KDK03_16980 [Rhodobacteraceae bacterium]|nr:hypothetical protein [Paracoccaceae bacterium]
MDTVLVDRSLSDELRVQNAELDVPPDIAEALVSRRAEHRDSLVLREQGDLFPEDRSDHLERRRTLLRTLAEPLGLDLDRFEQSGRESAAAKSALISEILRRRIDVTNSPSYLEPVRIFPEPPPTDHSFWWAETHASVAPDMRADFRAEGLHFLGGPKVDDFDGEMHAHFGAVARFALQPERMPVSPSGWYRSLPHVELSGGIVAFAPDWDLLQGNGIASCNLVLRQTLFQWKFGPSGPVAGVVAEAVSQDPWQIYLKNTGFSRRVDLPGFKPIPEVGFHETQFLRQQELWAEVEVRFEIYLNTAGALVWCDPSVLLRHSQWPLNVLA